MANTFLLKLLTPYQNLFEGPVEAVGMPGEQGEFGVLSDHAKLASGLKPGVVRFVTGDTTERFVVGGGFAEVTAKGVVVLADSAEKPSQIDLPQAEESRDRARAELKTIDPTDTALRTRLEARLARAENRIKAARSV